jgi:hypothetical protein
MSDFFDLLSDLSNQLAQVGDHVANLSDHTTNLGEHAASLSDHATNLSDHAANLGDHATNLDNHAADLGNHVNNMIYRSGVQSDPSDPKELFDPISGKLKELNANIHLVELDGHNQPIKSSTSDAKQGSWGFYENHEDYIKGKQTAYGNVRVESSPTPSAPTQITENNS